VSTLRPYQRDAIMRVQSVYREGASSVCLQMPTGAGKSHAAIGDRMAPEREPVSTEDAVERARRDAGRRA